MKSVFFMFSAVLLLSILIFPSVDGFRPSDHTTINGTATSNDPNDPRDYKRFTPQFFISDKPISLLIESYLWMEKEDFDTVLLVKDPNGKISEFDVKVISDKMEFFYTVNVDDPLGIYHFSIPNLLNGTFEILSDIKPDEKDESQIPEWIRNIFIWYGEQKVTETELINAIRFLVNNGIINLDEKQ